MSCFLKGTIWQALQTKWIIFYVQSRLLIASPNHWAAAYLLILSSVTQCNTLIYTCVKHSGATTASLWSSVFVVGTTDAHAKLACSLDIIKQRGKL